MARRTYVPPELAAEARELLIAFARWAADPRQEPMLKNDDWTWERMIDAFIMECGGNGDLEVEDDGAARLPEEGL